LSKTHDKSRRSPLITGPTGPYGPHGADLLMNPAKHGCRYAERDLESLTVPR